MGSQGERARQDSFVVVHRLTTKHSLPKDHEAMSFHIDAKVITMTNHQVDRSSDSFLVRLGQAPHDAGALTHGILR